jgi:hypothetical protein
MVSGVDLGPVDLQAACELLGLAQSDQVPAGHLIDSQAQAVPNQAALEAHREEAVVPTLEESDGHLRPRREGPGLSKRCSGLDRRRAGHRLRRDLGWDVVEKGVQLIRVILQAAAVSSGLFGPC